MNALPARQFVLSDAAYRLMDRELAKFPADQKQSAVMAALRIAQEEIGWLPEPALEQVATYLGMPVIAVYEIATFYAMYHLAPVGRHTIRLCTNLPCALSGATAAAAHLQQRLAVGFGQTSADGAVTLQEGECLGACGDAPVLLLDNRDLRGSMSNDRLDALLEALRR
jgi:NADH-quinone oxidoreductase subunit E